MTFFSKKSTLQKTVMKVFYAIGKKFLQFSALQLQDFNPKRI
jgi:hypothetical protein